MQPKLAKHIDLFPGTARNCCQRCEMVLRIDCDTNKYSQKMEEIKWERSVKFHNTFARNNIFLKLPNRLKSRVNSFEAGELCSKSLKLNSTKSHLF